MKLEISIGGTGGRAKELVKDRIDKDVYSVASPSVYKKHIVISQSA